MGALLAIGEFGLSPIGICCVFFHTKIASAFVPEPSKGSGNFDQRGHPKKIPKKSQKNVSGDVFWRWWWWGGGGDS
jgi:hypothetical protein